MEAALSVESLLSGSFQLCFLSTTSDLLQLDLPRQMSLKL